MAVFSNVLRNLTYTNIICSNDIKGTEQAKYLNSGLAKLESRN